MTKMSNILGDFTVDYDETTDRYKINPIVPRIVGPGTIVKIEPGTTAPTVTTGLRYNEGKPRYDLVPPEMVHGYAEVATMGAKKYAPRNWELGMNWMETCGAALLRHFFAWSRGEDLDPESGLSHMKHVLWNAAALVTYQERGVGTDDRKKVVSNEK